MPNRVIRKKMGELLIERRIINEEQLNLALEEQRQKGGYISQHLIAKGFATEFDIANCLASQYGFAHLPLANYTIPEDVLDIIPLELIKIYSILPVDKLGGTLTVSMADPLNDGVIDMLKQITGYDIEIFISTYSELCQAIEQYFGEKMKRITREFADKETSLREKMAQPFIQTMGYSGHERRRYERVNVDLDMLYFWQANVFKAKIKNISYVGILFVCRTYIPIDENIYTNIACKFYAGDAAINSVVQVVRVEKKASDAENGLDGVTLWDYVIAGFFNFMTTEDKSKLADFLKDKLPQKPS